MFSPFILFVWTTVTVFSPLGQFRR
jgi:hypothetical protein